MRANLLVLAEENPDEFQRKSEVIQCATICGHRPLQVPNAQAALADEEDFRVRGAFVFAEVALLAALHHMGSSP